MRRTGGLVADELPFETDSQDEPNLFARDRARAVRMPQVVNPNPLATLPFFKFISARWTSESEI